MKKSLFCICLLALLACGGITAVHLAVSDTADQVEYRETTHIGDSAAAEQLELRFSCVQDDRLFWDTTLVPRQQIHTDFHVTPKPEHYYEGGTHAFLYCELPFNSGISGAFEDGLHLSDSDPMTPLYQTAAQRTKPGTTHSEILRTRDYFPTLPLKYTLDLPNQNLDRWFLEYQLANRHLSDDEQAEIRRTLDFLSDLDTAFSFPTPADHQLVVQVSKNADGAIQDVNCVEGLPEEPLRDVPFAPDEPSAGAAALAVQDSPFNCAADCWSLQIGDRFYFVPEMRRTDGDLLDYSKTPGGYGLYCLDVHNPDNLTIDNLSLVLPLDPGQHMEWLGTDDTERRILLATSQDGQETLHFLDPATGALLQSFPAGSVTEKWYSYWTQGPLVLIMCSQETFQVLLQDENGDYHHEFNAAFPTPEEFPLPYISSYSLAFHNGRLAVAIRGEGDHHHNPICAIDLLVWDKTGLLYAGTYSSSLDRSPAANGYSVQPILRKPLELRFIP